MFTQSWRKDTSLTERILKFPGDFDFVQIVRILEYAGAYSKLEPDTRSTDSGDFSANASKPNSLAINAIPSGNFSPPSRETLRFVSNSSLTFPGSEVLRVKQKTSEENQIYWEVLVNFVGLTGSMGVLPFHYTETILQRLKHRDEAFLRFLNLFNHRITSLFYKAATRYRLPLQYESAKIADRLDARKISHEKTPDSHTKALLALVGLGTGKLRHRHALDDETIIYYSGIFSQQIRTSTGLKQIIFDYFQVPVKIREMVAQWQELIDDVRTRLAWREQAEGQNACLGKSCMLGKRGWYTQGKVQIIIGPLNKQQYQQFAPGANGLRKLQELVRLYLGLEHDFDIIVQIKRSDISARVALDGNSPPIMGWSAWLAEKELSGQKNKLMNIKLSSARLNRQARQIQ